MDAKSEQKVINNFSNIDQETNKANDISVPSVKSDSSKKEKESQIRVAAIAVNARSPMPSNTASANSDGQATDHNTSSVMDEKSEQNAINDISKIVQETRGADDKSLHSDKSGCNNKEKEDKINHPDRNDHKIHYISHDKVLPVSTIKPHALHQQQHLTAHYTPAVHHLRTRFAVPHECPSNSPIVANPYADQGQISQIPVHGPVDDHNKSESVSLSAYHYKSDNTDMKRQSPAAHQQTRLNTPYHSRGHSDGRTSKPAHLPSSHICKKDSSHNQQIPPSHNPANVKRPKTEHSSTEHSRTHLRHQESHKGSSVSPGPNMPSLSWHMTSNYHSSIPKSPRVILLNNEQSNRRMNLHTVPQLSSLARVHAPPPPAHTMSQSSNVPARTLPLKLVHSSQVPYQDVNVLRQHPVLWEGLLALKNATVSVQMLFVSGNPNVARASLPPEINGEVQPVRIAQRMRLEPAQLDGVYSKIQMVNDHCILMAWPKGKDHKDLVQQSDNMKFEFVSYLLNKDAAGIVNAAAPGTQQTAFVIHIFPTCQFIQNNLSRLAPNLLQNVEETTLLWIIIGTA